MTQQPDEVHAKRLATFHITAEDIALLRRHASFAETRLPKLLESLHSSFNGWPEIQTALKDPKVHAARLSHWSRAAAGRLDDGFVESAQNLASAFYENEVPGYAVAICHFSVLKGVLRDLGLDQDDNGGAWKGLFGKGRRNERAALRATLTKVAWLDLELLLETYAQAEHDSRALALRQMATTIESEAASAVEQVDTLTQELSKTANTMSATAAETGESAGQAATAADQTLNVTQLVAGSAEQLAGAVDEITRQMTKSRQVAECAVTASKQAQGSIDELSQQAANIGQIAAMIADIAGRTNLLALNATIEAARAGDAGKGFAVVAGEVKQLASQTGRATREITEQIDAIQQATKNAATAVASIAATISEIDHIGTSVAAAVEEQSASTAEIARSMAEAAETARMMVAQNGNVQSAAQQASVQAGVVEQTSTVLQNAVRSLRQAVIRVVRTSTRDVDRREHQRFSAGLRGQITLNGNQTQEVWVENLSLGGAMLQTYCRAPIGTRGTLQIEGLTLAFTIQNEHDDGIGIGFSLDATQAERLTALIHRNQSRRAA
jgi:methyl-accepting chemotaxis protein